ncbi:MAG: YciI family protein [Actinomycetota bacterium]
MAKYLLAYHGGSMPETPKDQARVMAQWGKWYQKLGKSVVDPGNPVGQARSIASTGRVTKAGGKSAVSGYTVIAAADIDKAVKLASGCPILKAGGSIEVCETFDAM